jgi:hypothetical protein
MIEPIELAEIKGFRDLKKEPRVRAKSDKREQTHSIALVPTNHLQHIWPDVRDQLSKAIARSKGRWTMEMLFVSILNGQQHLWVAFDANKNIDGVGTTEVIEYPGKRMLAVQFLGGDNFNDWVWDMLARFNDWARDNHCGGIEATARMGFWKWLEQDDFERSYVIFEKRFNDG